MDHLAKFLAFEKREQTNRRAPPPPSLSLSMDKHIILHNDALRRIPHHFDYLFSGASVSMVNICFRCGPHLRAKSNTVI